jgi:Zn-finger nucleic acid-binding protein
MQTEALNCPNCGAAVESDRTQCEFCKSRLKTVGCPSCLGLMFVGNKFCGHCGAAAAQAELVEDKNPGECPRCKLELQPLKIGSANMRECERCGGFWTSVDVFEHLCDDKEQQSAVLMHIGDQNRELDSAASINYVPCPDCKQLMNRSNFARISGVIIDLCKRHGVWFDADELPKIISFIEDGGLRRSREKEKIALEDERSRVRDEQLRLQMMERGSSGGRGYRRNDDDDGGGLSGFVAALFDL